MQINSSEEIFQEYLQKNETIRWAGQPQRKVIFTSIDVFLVPFSIMWGGFAIFWVLSAAGLIIGKTALPEMAFFGIPFIIVGLYLIFGRFWLKDFRKRNTYYAVTNQRILIVQTSRGIKIREADIDKIPDLKLSSRRDGVGSIVFAADTGFTSIFSNQFWYLNTGLDIWGSSPIAFLDIENATEVYKTIQSFRQSTAQTRILTTIPCNL